MSDSLPRADDAGLYVLDLLDPQAKRAFEEELESSAELRRQVAALQTNLEALALGSAPCPPPPRVWHEIARRTAEPPVPAVPAVSAWVWVRRMLASGWAVAAVLAVFLVLNPSWKGSNRVAAVPARLPAASPDGTSRHVSGIDGPAGGPDSQVSGRDTRHPSGSGGSTGRVSNSALAETDAGRLQDRVRFLSDQVAMLTQVLTHRTVVPAGAARLQVFRLVGTNSTHEAVNTVSTEPRQAASTTVPRNTATVPAETISDPNPATATTTTSLVGATTTNPSNPGSDFALTLVLAAARQLASSPTTPSTPNRTATDAAVPSSVALPGFADTGFAAGASRIDNGSVVQGWDPGAATSHGSIQVVDLAATTPGTTLTSPGGSGVDLNSSLASGIADSPIVSSADGTAFGAYSADTGNGAIAFRVPVNTDGQAGSYQLWVSDGVTSLVQSVGYTSPGAISVGSQVVVLKFTFDGAAFSSPSFMITKEPVGGSPVPTGIVVAQPPTTTPSPDNP